MYLGHIVKVLFISEDTGTFKIATCSWKSNAFLFFFFFQLFSIAYGRIGSLKIMQMDYM